MPFVRLTFKEKPVVLERFHLAVNPAQGVHEQRGAKKIHPADMGGVEAVYQSNQQIGPADDSQRIADFFQMGDFGIDVGEQIKLSQLRFPPEIHPLHHTSHIFRTDLFHKGQIVPVFRVHFQTNGVFSRLAGGEVVGIGIAIEKGQQQGGRLLREAGYQLESIAILESMDYATQTIVFRGQPAQSLHHKAERP